MPKAVNLTEEQIKDLKELTSPEIREKYGWYSSKIQHYRKKYKITDYPLACKGIDLTEEQIQDLSKLDTYQLKDKYGWSSSKVGNYRTRYYVKDYPHVRRPKKVIPPRNEISQMTLEEVMDKYNVCLDTAKNWFSQRKIPYKYRRYDFKDIIKNKDKEIKDLKHYIRNMRMVYSMPFMRDAELARAFNLSRERVRQIRNTYQVSLCFKDGVFSEEGDL